MIQTQCLISSGLELAKFVVNLDILQHAWTAITELCKETSTQNEGPSSLVKFKVFELPNCTIIAFFTWPANSKDYVQGNGGGDFVTSSTLKDSFPLFNFLSTKANPNFSINRLAFQLFSSIFGVLPFLKLKIDNSKPLIITGNSLGGSVATLFTLSLLEIFNFTNTKRPLCITFGSPLIGDEGLQSAISNYSAWNSCFLHVVSDQDPVPRVLINGYKPFGTFLLCSELGCSCFEDPQTILELLMVAYSGSPENQDPNKVFESYGTFVEHLNRKVLCKDTTDHESLIDWSTPILRAGIITQLAAIGLVRSQQPQSVDINSVIEKTERQEKIMAILNKQAFDPTKRLNEIKVYMAYLEQYKKVSKDNRVGYYDRYKNVIDTSNIDVAKHKKILTCYWEEMVDQAEKRPQTVGASLRTRWLFGGTNYRRMIEPLDIADYYKAGKQGYINQGRPKHYIKLEQLLKETEKPSSVPNEMKKQNVASCLTEDSCFWAHVEEALISCKLLTNEGSSVEKKDFAKKELIEFEKYVLDLMKNYAVSSEIFLLGSSFMKWWEKYREITGTYYSSSLTNLLKNYNNYEAYAKGSLVIPNVARHDKGYQDITFIDKQKVSSQVRAQHAIGYEHTTFLGEQKYETSEIRFSNGLELANFVVSSGVLYHSWAAVRDLYGEINQNEQPSLSVRFKVSQRPNFTIIAFFTWPASPEDYIMGRGGGDLVSSSTLKESFPLFEFLRTKTNPDFSFNKAALELFASIRDKLPSLKSEIDSKPVIITGSFLGGSVASLFTLWLLEKINLSSTKTRPFCITFGSPLLGDDGLQETVSKYPTWNSCFLHVVFDQDPIPRVLILPKNPIGSASQTNVYKPSGTFLLCSDLLGCTCLEDSQFILESLMATYSEGPGNQNPNQLLDFYEAHVQHLNDNKTKILAPQLPIDNVVGFVNESTALVKQLIRGKPELDVISIIGIGGSGKTTLAKNVYNNFYVKAYFHCRVWVYVSQDFRFKELLIEILKSEMRTSKYKFHPTQDLLPKKMTLEDMHEEDLEDMEEKYLKDILHEYLSTKKYLVVLDNFWTIEVWNKVKFAFPNSLNGSRLLITCREKEVALHASGGTPPYHPPFLDKDDSWELLRKQVFRLGECPPELEKLGKRIAKTCYGLPLSIVVMGGLLVKEEKEKTKWEKYLNPVYWNPFGDESSRCEEILDLSYTHLPPHLKPCCLYFGIYPEDYEIPVSQLIQLWIAEGFIESTEDRILEDIAEDYLDELIDRSLIQVASRRTDRGAKTCRIHDLLRDFCISKSEEEEFGSDKEKFFEVRKDIKILSTDRSRRLSVLCSAPLYMSSNHTEPSGARSLFFFDKDYPSLLKKSCWEWVRRNFELVQVLHFGKVNPYIIPGYIDNFIHLKYLRIDDELAYRIPDSIFNIQTLETLVANNGSKVIRLSAAIWKLRSLRNLYMSAAMTFCGETEVEALQSLQVLSTVVVDPQTESVIVKGKLPNVRKLGIRMGRNEWNSNDFFKLPKGEKLKSGKIFESLHHLHHLQTLKITDCSELPSGANSLPQTITKITLIRVDINSMAVLGNLPKLRVLKLQHCSSKVNLNFTRDLFRKLEVLKLDELSITEWELERGAMPRLAHLVIKNCTSLTMLPEELCNMPSLLDVEVLWTTLTLARVLQELQMKMKVGVNIQIYPSLDDNHYKTYQ